MFCTSCGSPLPDGTTVCTQCGTPQQAQNYQQPVVETPPQAPVYTQPQGYDQAPVYQQPQGYNQVPPYNQPQGYNPTPYAAQQFTPVMPQHPMKWYKFLINFALIAGAILNILSAITYFTGSIYTTTAGLTMDDVSYVYSQLPALKVVDVVYAIALIAMGVIGFITRKKLKDFEAAGPKMLYLLYALSAILPLVYNLMVCPILDVAFGDALIDLVPTLIGQGIVLFCSYKYFSKREALFIN